MKCRYKSIGHTFSWVECKLRYGQASPWDLLRVKGTSPDLKLASPGRRTCELDRPDCVIFLPCLVMLDRMNIIHVIVLTKVWRTD